jgi:rod shape-determining protein MreB
MEVLARWRDSGLPRKIVISAEQLRGALDVPLAEIRECVLDALESTSPEVAADIAESGLILSGGGALLHGIADMLSEATGLPARVADDPATCVLRGARKVTGRSEQK